MKFVGRVAIILVLTTAAAAVHSMYTPIYRDLGDKRAREAVVTAPTGQTPVDPSGADTAVQPLDEGGPAAGGDAGEPDAAELPEYYISVERAFELWDEGMPFVDARTDAERVVGTIEGAVHLETRNFLNGTAGPLLDQLDRAFPVVVFCGGGECDASENVAKRLDGWGFTEVYIMHEGFAAWEAAGHPTEAVGGG